MACDGVGPSQTCLNLIQGAYSAGYKVDVFSNRCRIRNIGVPMTLALPGPLSYLPYRWVQGRASAWIEHRFIDSILPGDIAYLWPAVSLATHKTLFERGIPIALEGINTRMASAKRILDAAYEAFGVAPAHGITDARISEEEEKFGYASAIFAPSRQVVEALSGSALDGRIIRTSYGVDTSEISVTRRYEEKDALTVMFCGYACVRKGVHLLLDAWMRIPGKHRLQLVGQIEPAIATRYRDFLASDRVEVVGFVDDVHRWFDRADVFVLPSLEEGDPLVTYEAAIHGLPIVASSMGAGRLGDEDGAMIVIDPSNPETFVDALRRVMDSAELRAELGHAAQAHASKFDWHKIGAERARALQALIETDHRS
jgi:glycosyltransferase involved in cell wall biosynthesis